MKRILTLIICVLLITTVTNAQDSTRRAKEKSRIQNTDSTRKQNLKNKGITKKNLKELDLSKDQEKQIDDIHTKNRQEKEKINNDKTLTAEQKKEKIKAIDRESKNKVNSVLTPEQRQKVKEKKANGKKEG
jgi:periplasmic protein CpxP/Spy